MDDIAKWLQSGKDYERHQALNNVLGNDEYAVKKAYVFCQDNIKEVGRVTYLPVYMLMFLHKTPVEDAEYKFDLTGLK